MSGRGRPRKPREVPRAERTPRDLSLPVDALSWSVPEDEHKQRLDRFLLRRLSWRSRTSLVELIEAGRVLRDGEPVTRKAHKVLAGETISVSVPPPEEEVRHEELGLRLHEAILHDDPQLVVLAKPPGLVVHPVGRIRVNTLIQALHWLYQHGPRRGDGSVPRICHRLDRDTSGVLVLAKTQPARSRLQAAFEGREVRKTYLAVLQGEPAAEAGRIEDPLGPDEEAEINLMMTVRPDGVPSRTDYEVLERFPAAGVSLVRFQLHTGRQHQIRVHAARSLGCPVLCDPLYGDGALAWPAGGRPWISRLALHARRLVLPHPQSGEELSCEAPLPADLEGLLARLRATPS